MKITSLKSISLALFIALLVLILVDKFNFLKSILSIIAFGLIAIDSQKNKEIKNNIIVTKNNKVKLLILLSFLLFILFFLIFFFL